jgi:hypothetical protein
MSKNPPQISPAEAERARSVTQPKKKGDQRASTQQHLSFSEIKDGIVVMRDGGLRMVILCSPTNFDLKSPAEKDAMEYAYQGFLNGLHFPIQIVVQSRRVDLDNYLENLENIQANQSNGLLAGLMEDYIYNIRDLLQEVNIMDKRFYVVVPYYTEIISKKTIFSGIKNVFQPVGQVTQTTVQFEQRKRELLQRTQLVAGGLASIGIRSVLLNTQEVIEMLYNSYNIDESQNQAMGNIADMSAPVVERSGQLEPPHPEAPEQPPADLFEAATAAQAAVIAQQASINQSTPPPPPATGAPQ